MSNLQVTIINIPITYTGKKNLLYLSMNWYRNENQYKKNNIKKLFSDQLYIACLHMIGITFEKPVRFEYTLYRKDNRTVDLGNIGSVVDKFTEDVIVKLGIIKDDNTDFVKEILFRDGGIDKLRPRADLIITEV